MMSVTCTFGNIQQSTKQVNKHQCYNLFLTLKPWSGRRGIIRGGGLVCLSLIEIRVSSCTHNVIFNIL